MRSLRSDRDGNVLIYVTLAFGVLLGAVGIALDSTRLYISDTEAQAAADAVSIAAAYQLDGQPDAITRATNAAINSPLVSNKQTFGETATAGTTVITGIRFLSDLPPSDDAPITSTYETNDPALAAYVEVTTETVTHRSSFIQVLGTDGNALVRARAVAGRGLVVCGATPLAICNPNEADAPVGQGVGAGFNASAYIGRQLLLKAQGAGAAWAPGNFGFLNDPAFGMGAPQVASLLATASPATQCVKAEVDTRPGAVASVRTAFNTRFDIYDNPHFGTEQGNANYRPAQNVTKGRVYNAGGGGGGGGNANLLVGGGFLFMQQSPFFQGNSGGGNNGGGNNGGGNNGGGNNGGGNNGGGNNGGGGGSCGGFTEPGAPDATKMPRDSNISNTQRFGNGDWDCASYWSVNHGTIPPLGCNLNPPTVSRYSIYRMEIENPLVGIPNPMNGGTTLEDGNPTCYSGSPSSITDDPDRREFQFAVLNCRQHSVTGASVNVPVLAYIKSFMTEPVGDESTPGNNDFELYLEIVDELTPNNSDLVKTIVQIYR